MGNTQSDRLWVGVLETKGYTVGQSNASSGLFRREQDGRWTHFGWSNIRLFGFAFSPHEQGMILLAAGNGVLRSKDGGESWRVTNGWEMTEVLDVCIHPERPGVVMAATAYGIWFSNDNGDTWTLRENTTGKPGDSFISCIVNDPSIASRWVAGTENGVIVSSDDGETWINTSAEHAVRRILPDPTAPGKWYMVAASGGVFTSSDNANTWQVLPGLPSKFPLYSLAIHQNLPGILAAGGFESGPWLSRDGGASWEELKAPYDACTVKALCFGKDEDGPLYLGTADDGLYVQTSAGWQHLGLADSFISSLIFVTS